MENGGCTRESIAVNRKMLDAREDFSFLLSAAARMQIRGAFDNGSASPGQNGTFVMVGIVLRKSSVQDFCSIACSLRRNVE